MSTSSNSTSSTNVSAIDGSLDWSGGVNSNRNTTLESTLNTNGMPRNVLSWLVNGTVRGGTIGQRAGWLNNGTVIQKPGLFQGSFFYEPSGAYPQILFMVDGVLYIIPDVDNPAGSLIDLSAAYSLTMPATQPHAYFVQAERFAAIQSGDYVTKPLFWDGSFLRRSNGIGPGTLQSYPIVDATVKELPPAGPMDYYQGRIWYGVGRSFGAGDIVGSSNSGDLAYSFKNSVLRVTENPLCLGGDNFSVPDSSGNVRCITHLASNNSTLGQGDLVVMTRNTVFGMVIPVTRGDWINASSDNQPKQYIMAFSYGAVNDRSVIRVNSDIFYRTLEPGVRSLTAAVKNFTQWGDTQAAIEESRVLQFEDRGLLAGTSATVFDNRLLITALPKQTANGIVYQAIMPLNFDLIGTISNKLSPVWEGMWTGLDILQIITANFGGRDRCFAFVISRKDQSLQLWEITNYSYRDHADARITTIIEFPAFTWGKEYELRELLTLELWVDRVVGKVDATMEYRVDSDSCWQPWHIWQFCAARNSCEDETNPFCYNPYPLGPGYQSTMTLPHPPQRANAATMRPAYIGYQFQPRLTIHGSCRVRGVYLHAIKRDRELYARMVCSASSGLNTPSVAPGINTSGGLDSFTVPKNPTLGPTPPSSSSPNIASNPYPADGSTGIVNTMLSWKKVFGATSYKVYVNGALQSTQAGTTFLISGLSPNTPVSWKVDAINSNGTTAGPDWVFTTGVAQPFSYDDPNIVMQWEDESGTQTGNLAAFQANADPAGVTKIAIPSLPSLTPVNVTSITGLASLPNLTSISIGNLMLTSLDVSQNPLLTNCDAGTADTSLTAINVSGCPELLYLDCSANVNGQAGGNLGSLDITHNPKLTHLYCFNQQIPALDLDQNTLLQFLGCYYNRLTSLDITDHFKLQYVDAHANLMPSAAVDDLLCEFKNNMVSGSYLSNVSHGIKVQQNAPPGSTGLTCATSLLSMGFGVMHD